MYRQIRRLPTPPARTYDWKRNALSPQNSNGDTGQRYSNRFRGTPTASLAPGPDDARNPSILLERQKSGCAEAITDRSAESSFASQISQRWQMLPHRSSGGRNGDRQVAEALVADALSETLARKFEVCQLVIITCSSNVNTARTDRSFAGEGGGCGVNHGGEGALRSARGLHL